MRLRTFFSVGWLLGGLSERVNMTKQKKMNATNITAAAPKWTTPCQEAHHEGEGMLGGAEVGKNATPTHAALASSAAARSHNCLLSLNPLYVTRYAASATKKPTKAAFAPV